MHDIKKICASSNCYGCSALKQYCKKIRQTLEFQFMIVSIWSCGDHSQGANLTDSTKLHDTKQPIPHSTIGIGIAMVYL